MRFKNGSLIRLGWFGHFKPVLGLKCSGETNVRGSKLFKCMNNVLNKIPESAQNLLRVLKTFNFLNCAFQQLTRKHKSSARLILINTFGIIF